MKNTIWMPYEEYLAYQELVKEIEPELVLKMKYFFWNNFNDEGYEEWRKQIKNESVHKED